MNVGFAGGIATEGMAAAAAVPGEGGNEGGYGMTGSFKGMGETALRLIDSYMGDLEAAAGHAVFQGLGLVDIDTAEARRWLAISEMLEGKDVEGVGHA